jgi:GntR family transcriptional regulator / MocR family aminotransferase
MARQSSALALNLRGPAAGTELYRWLYEQLRTAILDGRLQPGARLPATRDMAGAYGLSRTTIVTAYEQLKAEGYLDGRTGSGTYVSRILPEDLLNARGGRADERVGMGGEGSLPHRRIALSQYARRLTPFRAAQEYPVRAFRTNQPALDLFPTTLWAQVAASRLRRATTAMLGGGAALGYRPLREAVAEYLNTSRGVKCAADQVLIVSGAQEGFDRTARLLLNAGDEAWMEEPGYVGAAVVLRAMGAKIRAVPVDEEGLDFEAAASIPSSHRRNRKGPGRAASHGSGSRPKLVYVTPGHQFPLGMTMSLRRRLALLEWARKSGVMIFEDDYDSEYRYSGRPVPALQGLDRASVVIFGGSFSAVMFPGLRLGYLVVPEEMVDIFAAAQSVSTHHPALLGQAVLCDFIREGHFARHIRRMREIYAERLGVLLKAAGKELGGVLEISNVEAGLQTIGSLCGSYSADKLVKEAAKRNVELRSLSRYYSRHKPMNGIVMGFAAVEPKELRRGVEVVAEVLRDSHPSHKERA